VASSQPAASPSSATTQVATPATQTPTTAVAPTPASPVVAAPAPVEAAVPSTESTLATGSNYDTAISNLIEMGFLRDQVVAAMRAAFNNPDRAAEYLMTVGCLGSS
jgi:UV excision repair protein RAD23